MPARHSEAAFETAIEAGLLRSGWAKGDPKAFDRQRALQLADLVAFVQETQPELWAELQEAQGAGLTALLLDTLVKQLDMPRRPSGWMSPMLSGP